MSVTQDYKTITLSRHQAFAVVRGLRSRVNILEELLHEYVRGEAAEKDLAYLREMIQHAKGTLQMIDSVKFGG